MKKYIAPIIFLFIDIALYSFRPDLTGIRMGMQYFLFFSLSAILIKKTHNNSSSFTTLLKWTSSIGLVVPIFLDKNDLLVFDPFYIADMVILVPILFYELTKKDNTESNPIDSQENPQGD